MESENFTSCWTFPALLTKEYLHLTFDPCLVTSCRMTRLQLAWRGTSVCLCLTHMLSSSLSQSLETLRHSVWFTPDLPPSPLSPPSTNNNNKCSPTVPLPFSCWRSERVSWLHRAGRSGWERVGGVRLCAERGEEVGRRRRWVLAFSSGIFLSVVSFFPFLSFCPPLAPWMETRLSRLSGDRQYGPDNGIQSEGGGGGGGGAREAGTGPQGKTGAEWRISLQSTDTLLNYSTLSLPRSPSDTHTLSFLKHTPHFNLALLNEAQRHLNWKQHCSLKLETSFYHRPQEFLSI